MNAETHAFIQKPVSAPKYSGAPSGPKCSGDLSFVLKGAHRALRHCTVEVGGFGASAWNAEVEKT